MRGILLLKSVSLRTVRNRHGVNLIEFSDFSLLPHAFLPSTSSAPIIPVNFVYFFKLHKPIKVFHPMTFLLHMQILKV